MKYYWILAGLMLLALSLFGAVKSFATPLQTTTLKSVKVLEYQQEGAFDYRVTAKPVYFYSDARTSAADSVPQIPLNFIENLTLTYSYSAPGGTTAETLTINAILESPGVWKKTLNLVPTRGNTASLSIPVNLQYFHDLGNTIEKEIGISAPSHDLTIQAVVSRPGSEDFVQLLPLKINATYLKISDSLVAVRDGRQGRFEYSVKLGDNTLYGPITIQSPLAPPAVQSVVLGQQDTIFTKFIDSMNITYNYHLTSPKAIGQTQTRIILEAILENPDKWSKTYTLTPPATQEGEVHLSLPLDLAQFSAIFDTIQQETGIASSKQNLTIKATLHTTAQTDQGAIDKAFSQSINTDLRDSILTWSGELKKNSPGSIEISQPVSETAKLFKLPVIWLRTISCLAAVLIVAALLVYLRRSRRPIAAPNDQQTRNVVNKYKDIVIEVREWPDSQSGQNVLTVDSAQALVMVAQGLLKPVNHATRQGDQVYWVNDDLTRYEFRLDSPAPVEDEPEAN
jgi:hypothetical protein